MAPFREAGGYDGSDQQPVIAYDGDVAQIASALTRFALDAACAASRVTFHTLLT